MTSQTSPTTLSGPAFGPAAGGAPKQLVILLHGIGADGNDLIGLAPHWSALLPDAEFLSPNAPFACDMGPMGYQWFSLLDRSPAAVLEGVRTAAPIVQAFIDVELEKRGLDDGALALIGFSQGAMLALYTGLRRAHAPAAILGYSGALVGAEVLGDEIRARAPVMLIHGDVDAVVSVLSLPAAETKLKEVGVKVETHLRPGLGHSIDEEGLKLGGEFLVRAFS